MVKLRRSLHWQGREKVTSLLQGIPSRPLRLGFFFEFFSDLGFSKCGSLVSLSKRHCKMSRTTVPCIDSIKPQKGDWAQTRAYLGAYAGYLTTPIRKMHQAVHATRLVCHPLSLHDPPRPVLKRPTRRLRGELLCTYLHHSGTAGISLIFPACIKRRRNLAPYGVSTQFFGGGFFLYPGTAPSSYLVK